MRCKLVKAVAMDDCDSSGDGGPRVVHMDDSDDVDVAAVAVSIGGGGPRREETLLLVRWWRAAPGANTPLLGRPDTRSWPSSPSVVECVRTFCRTGGECWWWRRCC